MSQLAAVQRTAAVSYCEPALGSLCKKTRFSRQGLFLDSLMIRPSSSLVIPKASGHLVKF